MTSTMTSTTRPAPIAQIRVIAPTGHAHTLITALAEQARTLLGQHASYRTHTRPAHRTGYVRAYLTVTRKEVQPVAGTDD